MKDVAKLHATSNPSINSTGEIYESVSPREELILLSLYGKELYGLQIPKAMEEASGKRQKLSIGSLYPTLHSLEQKGLIESRWGEEGRSERGGARRRYYKLKKSGIVTIDAIQAFRANLQVWQPT